jgi:secreted Zn-dependent insulinase-like peptidase
MGYVSRRWLRLALRLMRIFVENYREAAMTTFKFISMLRSTDLCPPHQKEVSTLSKIRFRFAEKRRPDDYAVWVTDKLAWPVPRELVIKAPHVVSEWNSDVTAQIAAFRTLEALSVKNSRTVIMAKKERFESIMGTQQWQTEPWYGTEYRVERLDEAFVQEVNRSFFHVWGSLFLLSHRQKVQTRSLLSTFLDQTNTSLSDWMSTREMLQKYASAGLKYMTNSKSSPSSRSRVPV